MAKRLSVLQHGPWDGMGRLLAEAARDNGVQLDVVEVWHQPIPALSPYDGLIVLGGSANVDQERQYPFLCGEKKAIADSIRDNRPYLGFCLGHQLLAQTMGAQIGNNLAASIGIVRGYLTHDGRHHQIFNGFSKTLPLLKWHTQAVQEPLPKAIQVLATSADCQVEAISVKGRPHLIGLQFDNYAATPDDIAAWVAKDERWLGTLNNGAINTTEILRAAREYCSTLRKDFHRLFTNFLAMT